MSYIKILLFSLLYFCYSTTTGQCQQPLRKGLTVEVPDLIKQKGKLNCPVTNGSVKTHKENGTITDGYPSPGVLFLTNDSLVTSITRGAVRGLTEIKGVGKVVIVRNGDYSLVYAGLQSVWLKEGDSVNLYDKIGILSKDDDAYALNFQIWKGQNKENPEDWLAFFNHQAHDTSVIDHCIEKDKIKYGGDWTNGDLVDCPSYQFTYTGDTSKKWGILTDPIDIRQVASFVLPIKMMVEKQIRDYSGDTFYRRLKFHSVEIAYPDSIDKFAGRHPPCNVSSCKSKFFFFYKFMADSQAVYNIGIAVNKAGEIISPLIFPKKADYHAIDTTMTVCKVIGLARQADKNIDPIEEITFDYNPKTKRFYWLISQKVQNQKEGKNKYNQVIIDASDSSKTRKHIGEVQIMY